ncbi:MAG: acyl-CoA dehydrogenase family protein [Parvibaculum sp.]|uniref:acyl-CoA dehydrogenase family protein n=1 Tax=Parvibaculum sp. TaxID=2024848 RepID=UPI003C783860
MNEMQTILDASVTKLLDDHSTKQAIQGAEEGGWPEALWNALVENGMTRILLPEAQEGAGATWSDAHVVIKAAGAHAAPVPLAEAILAGFVLGRAGITMPEGIVTVMEGDFKLNGGRLTGTAKRVPWGRNASHAVTLVESGWGVEAVLAPLEYARLEKDQNVAREPRDTLVFDNIVVDTAWAGLPGNALRLYGALMRATQMAGALDYLTRQSVQYANERTQFGKPIGKFQAIQQQLAVLSTQSAAVGIASAHAAQRADKVTSGDAAAFEIAVAKTRADDATSIATSIAHQVHGAIGFTYEHGLHFATRRLWSWRAEFGSGAEWADWLGRETIARGADALWPYVTAR